MNDLTRRWHLRFVSYLSRWRFSLLTTTSDVIDLSTAFVEPLTSSMDGDDRSFEGDFWDDTTEPSSIDAGILTTDSSVISDPTPVSGTVADPTQTRAK